MSQEGASVARAPIGVMGAGWVGLVTAACFAELGHEVCVRDVVPERIAELAGGNVPIYEPGLEELMVRNRERLRFTLDAGEVFSAARIVFVCVGTPAMYSGDADLSAVWTVLDDLPPLEERAILVMKSTVPVGTGQKVRSELNARGLAHVGYASNPEFLAEGTAVRDFMKPDRIVIGSFAQEIGDAVAALYEGLDAPIVRADVASAEMIKLASNAFLATRISFINEIANVCEVTGADVEQVAKGMGLDHRLGPHFLKAGIGFGGSCFPKDVAALKQLAGNSGYHFQLLNAVIEVNELQKRRVVGKLVKHLGRLSGKTIVLLGLAFKANTNDMREASSLVLASRLLAEGAHVRGWDPVAIEDARRLLAGVDLYEDVLEALEGADAAVLVTEWDELRRLPLAEARQVMRNPLLVDGRNILDPAEARTAGFLYEAIGRPAGADPTPRRRRSDLERATAESVPAVILVGGAGTRLRPLTERTPKPMLPLLGRPLLAYTFEQLRAGNVDRAVLACGYLPSEIEDHFGRDFDGLTLEYRIEPEPLGTGGGIRFAAEGIEGPFVALNGDSLREFDLIRLVEFHRERKALATVLLTHVEDPARYGIVRLDGGGRVQGFVEKPGPHEVDTDIINAGVYILEPEVLELIPPFRAVSIEREVFPALAERGALYGIALPGYWLDVGTPASYLQAHLDLIGRRDGVEVDAAAELGENVELVAPAVIGPGAVVEDDARIGPLAYIGSGARVGAGAAVERASVLPGASVGPGERVKMAIVSVEAGVLVP